MPNTNFHIAQDGSFIQDVTHLFLDDSDSKPNSDFISKMEKKKFKDVKKTDFAEMLQKLNELSEETDRQGNHVVCLTSDLAEQKRLNMELVLMVDQLKETGKQEPETSERIQSVIRAFRNDKFARITSFFIDGTEIEMTCSKMKQIVYWYPKGKVYFAKDDFIRDITTDKDHKYTFMEIVQYTHSTDPSKNRQCLVTGESAYTVHVLFQEDFENEEEGVLAPTPIVHAKISKLDETLAVRKSEVLNFMLNMGYTCPLHGLG